MKQRIFFVGDVHGCFEELQLLLKKAGYDPLCHRLILLGDLINKGPDSFKVLSYARDNKQVTSLMGNHEFKFIQALEQNLPLSDVLQNLKAKMGKKVKEWLFWIKSLPLYIEEEGFIAVHGGLVPGEHPRQSKAEYLLNIRYWDGTGQNMKNQSFPAWHSLYTGSQLVIYAHWAAQGLKIKKNSIGLDTGCVYGGFLSGLWLPEKKTGASPLPAKKSPFFKA